MPHALIQKKDGQLVVGPLHCTRESALDSVSPFEPVAGIAEILPEEVCAAAVERTPAIVYKQES